MTDSGVKQDNVPLAIAVILLTVLALSLGDAIIKSLSAGFVLWQIFVLRSLIVVPVLLILIKTRYDEVSFVPKTYGWTAVRSLMLAFMWVTYYAALPHLQLSIAAAAYYTLPIFITLFSAVFVGEPVKATGWLAVVLGFAGTLLILMPDTDAFNLYALLPLVSAMLYALAMILTRTKCRDEHPLILSGALNVTFILAGLVATLSGPLWLDQTVNSTFLSSQWTGMGRTEWIAIVILAAAILIGSVGAAIAYQSGPSSIIATFDFAYVGFAVIWGVIFFREVPDLSSIAGIVMIVVAGIIAVRS